MVFDWIMGIAILGLGASIIFGALLQALSMFIVIGNKAKPPTLSVRQHYYDFDRDEY
jgi:hypothetical protein